ncbi:MAG TPA: Ger(x)C family spore germination protein [Niallia sp.]|nr:Ger(x)C family spore germination protein [Niallia sp.]
MKRFYFALIIASCFVLSGCWDQSELGENSIVTGIAVDKGEKKKYKLSIESTAATELNFRTAQGFAPAFVYSIEGDTIGELTHLFNRVSSTHYILSHTRVLIIGEPLAKEGFLSFIDFFDRNREIRDDFKLIVAKEGNAEDLLKITNDYQKVSSLKVFTQLDNMLEDWGGAPGMKLKDFIRTYASKGQVPVLGAMTIQGSKEEGGSMDNLKQTVPAAIGKIDSLAFFKDGKLIGYLPIKDTRLLLWVQNRIVQTSLTIPYNNNNDFFGMRVLRSKTKVKAREVDGRPQFDIKIYIESVLDGSDKKVNLKKVYAFENLEKTAQEYLEGEFTQLFKKMQNEYGADIFGLGEMYKDQDYKSFKKYHDNWEEGFKLATIKTHVDLEIKRSGIRNNSNN